MFHIWHIGNADTITLARMKATRWPCDGNAVGFRRYRYTDSGGLPGCR